MSYEQAEKHHEQINCVITRLRIESNTLMRIQEEKKHSYLKENGLAIETGGNLIWQDCDPNVCLLQEALLSIRNAIDQLNMMSAVFYLTPKPKPKPEPVELYAIRNKETGKLWEYDDGQIMLITSKAAAHFTVNDRAEVVVLKEVKD